jgi:hypothetical protein
MKPSSKSKAFVECRQIFDLATPAQNSEKSYKQKTSSSFMEFDLLQLYYKENTSLLRCVRAYTIIPKYVKKPTEKNYKAEKIIAVLREIREKLNNEIGYVWQERWLKMLPFSVQQNTTKDWFVGRVSMPLIALVKLSEFGCEKEIEVISKHLDYFGSKTGNVAKIPKNISSDLAWLSAAILCDGHIRKDLFKVSFQVTDKLLAEKFRKLFCAIFEVRDNGVSVRPSHHGKKPLYRFDGSSRAIVHFLNIFFEIPRGNKCSKIRVPSVINKSSIEVKRAFLKGVFDTDGGKRGKGLGLTSASKTFVDQVYSLLLQFEIRPYKDSWVNKIYNKRAYGLKFKNDSHSNFLNRSI